MFASSFWPLDPLVLFVMDAENSGLPPWLVPSSYVRADMGA